MTRIWWNGHVDDLMNWRRSPGLRLEGRICLRWHWAEVWRRSFEEASRQTVVRPFTLDFDAFFWSVKLTLCSYTDVRSSSESVLEELCRRRDVEASENGSARIEIRSIILFYFIFYRLLFTFSKNALDLRQWWRSINLYLSDLPTFFRLSRLLFVLVLIFQLSIELLINVPDIFK